MLTATSENAVQFCNNTVVVLVSVKNITACEIQVGRNRCLKSAV